MAHPAVLAGLPSLYDDPLHQEAHGETKSRRSCAPMSRPDASASMSTALTVRFKGLTEVNEVGDALPAARAREKRLRPTPRMVSASPALEQAERHVLRPGFARVKEYLDAADRDARAPGAATLHGSSRRSIGFIVSSHRTLHAISLTVTVIRRPAWFWSNGCAPPPCLVALSLSFYTRAPV